jgi:hypothetical protein
MLSQALVPGVSLDEVTGMLCNEEDSNHWVWEGGEEREGNESVSSSSAAAPMPSPLPSGGPLQTTAATLTNGRQDRHHTRIDDADTL